MCFIDEPLDQYWLPMAAVSRRILAVDPESSWTAPSLPLHFPYLILVACDPLAAIHHAFPAGPPMSSRDARRLLAKELAAAVDAYQASVVIPHCAECSKPCCRLDPLVLELEWKQVKVFWRLDESRTAFDRRLSSGKGPEEIRAGNGLYYAHGKACPVYDEAAQSCRVYGQELKPAGCSDFPVYEDGDYVVADLRCEAVDLAALAAWIARAVGPEFRVVQSADKEFPFLVSLSVKKVGGRRAPDR